MTEYKPRTITVSELADALERLDADDPAGEARETWDYRTAAEQIFSRLPAEQESWQPGEIVLDANGYQWRRRDNEKHPWYRYSDGEDYRDHWPVRPLTRIRKAGE